MGNVLESDASTSSGTTTPQIQLEETRTDGDGMESDVLTTNIMTDGTVVSSALSKEPIMTPPITVLQTNKTVGIVNKIKSNATIISSNSTASKCKTISPRELPPRNQLILIKPAAKPLSRNSSYPQLANTSGKPKNPKFVPYEPYSAAITQMDISDNKEKNDSSVSCHSDSSTSSSRKASTNTVDLLSPTKTKRSNPLSSCYQQTSVQSQQQKEQKDNGHNNHSHSTTLLKERLKISEKDLVELQAENSRLKKLLVDSLSGSTPLELADEFRKVSLNFKSSGNIADNTQSISESFDNLNDAIEVWRSKFMSSCILVEQLSKENNELKQNVGVAGEIFRELKNSMSVTPTSFNKIQTWLHQNSDNAILLSSIDNNNEEQSSIME